MRILVAVATRHGATREIAEHLATSLGSAAIRMAGERGFIPMSSSLLAPVHLKTHWPAVEAATKRDMGVFIISPTDKGGLLQSPPPKLAELCRPLSPIAFNDSNAVFSISFNCSSRLPERLAELFVTPVRLFFEEA